MNNPMFQMLGNHLLKLQTDIPTAPSIYAWETTGPNSILVVKDKHLGAMNIRSVFTLHNRIISEYPELSGKLLQPVYEADLNENQLKIYQEAMETDIIEKYSASLMHKGDSDYFKAGKDFYNSKVGVLGPCNPYKQTIFSEDLIKMQSKYGYGVFDMSDKIKESSYDQNRPEVFKQMDNSISGSLTRDREQILKEETEPKPPAIEESLKEIEKEIHLLSVNLSNVHILHTRFIGRDAVNQSVDKHLNGISSIERQSEAYETRIRDISNQLYSLNQMFEELIVPMLKTTNKSSIF